MYACLLKLTSDLEIGFLCQMVLCVPRNRYKGIVMMIGAVDTLYLPFMEPQRVHFTVARKCAISCLCSGKCFGANYIKIVSIDSINL